MNQGYIKLSRKFFENALWKEPRQYYRSEAWLDLIQLARFEDSNLILNNRVIEVQRGEIAASRRFLEKRWSWGSTKVTNFLDYLKKEGMINQRQNNGQTIITICNYDYYNNTIDDCNYENKPATNHEIDKGKPATNQNKRKIRKDIKKELSNDSSKKATDVATRKDAFLSMLKYFSSRYPESMLTDFFNYWTELNPSRNKMRFEMQRTWETSKRLATWAKNDWNFSKTKQELPQMPSIFDSKPQNGDRNDKGQVWSEEKNRWLN